MFFMTRYGSKAPSEFDMSNSDENIMFIQPPGAIEKRREDQVGLDDVAVDAERPEQRHRKYHDKIIQPSPEKFLRQVEEQRIHTRDHQEFHRLSHSFNIDYDMEKGEGEKTPSAAFDDEGTCADPLDDRSDRIEGEPEYDPGKPTIDKKGNLP